MKKIYLGLLMSVAAITSSCDMDTTNYGVIDQGNAIETLDDCQAFVNGIYTHLRAKGSGTWLTMQDIQMDQFVGLVDNGNRMGSISTGKFNATEENFATLFYNLYIQIRDANYFVPKAEAMIASGNFSDADCETLNYYIATAKFSRAYAYWYLFDKWVDYKAADLDAAGKGLPIETNPVATGDRATYVGRSTIRETVKYINDELTDAFNKMTEYETNVSAANCNPNAIYVSSYTIAALQARFALLTEDYTTALAKAEYVINSGKYPLATGDDYINMWTKDEGSELLFVGWAQKGTGGMSIGTAYYTNNKKETSDYIPTADVILSYGNGDVRFDAFFELYSMTVNNDNYYAYAFSKYPGNPELNTKEGVNSCLQKSKLFRSSEMYLVAAEAAVSGTPKDEAKANQYLNDLRAARIEGYSAVTSSGAALVKAIREERGKELIGEGFRLSDLRRWGNGFTREAGFDIFMGDDDLEPLAYIMEVVSNQTNNVSYQPTNYHFVWPIPTREIQANPQLAGQQNPGYEMH